MSAEKLNWVERKATREKMLAEHIADVWQEAQSAVQDCCASYKKHYNPGIDVKLENGSRIRITIPFRIELPFPREIKRHVIVSLEASAEPSIQVAVDESSLRTFAIDADQRHAYIWDRQSGKELSPDEFSELAMESPLTTPPAQPAHSWVPERDY